MRILNSPDTKSQRGREPLLDKPLLRENKFLNSLKFKGAQRNIWLFIRVDFYEKLSHKAPWEVAWYSHLRVHTRLVKGRRDNVRNHRIPIFSFYPWSLLIGMPVIAASNDTTGEGDRRAQQVYGLPAGLRAGRGPAAFPRRVPAARSLAPTLLNGFLWLDVYLSFVVAFVSPLLNHRLTATFLSCPAACSWG